jgi:hypothetical protein
MLNSSEAEGEKEAFEVEFGEEEIEGGSPPCGSISSTSARVVTLTAGCVGVEADDGVWEVVVLLLLGRSWG